MTGQRRVRTYLTSAVGVVIGGFVFVGTLLGFGWNPGRTATTLGFASNFFDIQARSLLAGNLAVPTDSLGIEGFVVDGKTFMYFPPLPAVARLPILAITDEFDGQLTVLMMALAWGIFAVMSARFTWLARACLGRAGTPSLLECVGAAALIASITGGTVLTYDAALPWVYHEVYTWAAAFIMTGAFWMARYALRPSWQAAAWVGAATLGAVMTRTTGGFALAIVSMIFGSAALIRAGRGRRRAPLSLLLAGAIPVDASVLLNMAKFGHPYLFPLQDQVWTTVNSHRRLALESNGGTITGPQFIPSTALAYLRPDGIRFTEYFPWVSLPAEPARAVGGVVLDQTYRTGSVTAFMPLLSLLTIAAFVVVPILARRRRRTALLMPLTATVLLVGPVLMYGYITHRYTSEFVPLLVVGGSVGFWGMWDLLARSRRLAPWVLVVLMVLGTVLSLTVQLLTAGSAAAFAARGMALEDHVARQLALPGGSTVGALVAQGDRVPRVGRADTLFVQGECDALFVGTGDAYDPWALVQQRPLVKGLTLLEDYRPGRVPLFEIAGPQPRRVVLEVEDDRQARVVITASDGEVPGQWFPMHAGSEIRLGLGVRSDLGFVDVTSTPGGHVAYVPWAAYDEATGQSRPGAITAVDSDKISERRGLRVRDLTGRPLPLCRQALAQAR